MSDSKQHIIYTAQDIDRYLKRQMSAEEMHALEKAALDDPFLADAIEGYVNTPPASVENDIGEMVKALDRKTGTRVIGIGFKKIAWSAAAAVIILLGAATTWFWLRPSTENSIAQQKERESIPVIKPPQVPQDNLKTAIDTSASAIARVKEPTTISPPGKQKAAPAPVSISKPEEKNTGVNNLQKSDTPGNPGIVKNSAQPALKDRRVETANRDTEKLAMKRRATTDTDKSDIASATVQEENQKVVSAYFTPYVFSGTITDDKNKPLPFVNISIPNTPTNTYSDARGNFRLTSADSQLVVHLKSVGFEEKEITLAYAKPVNLVQLQPHSNALEEVVVGYGTQKKSIATGNTELKKQEAEKEEEPEAEPRDGWGAYDAYMMNNTRPPFTGNNPSFKGNVELSFTVNKHGLLTDFRIEQSTCTLCNKEAIRLIKEGPPWKLVSGEKPARVTLTLHF